LCYEHVLNKIFKKVITSKVLTLVYGTKAKDTVLLIKRDSLLHFSVIENNLFYLVLKLIGGEESLVLDDKELFVCPYDD